MAKNIKWTQDELIIALDFYLEHRGNIPNQQSDEIKLLSQQLNRLAVLYNLPRGTKFRNENGVHLTLSNFMTVDPDYAGKGMSHIGMGQRQIWKDFAGQRENLRAAKQAILQHIAHDEAQGVDSPPLLVDANALPPLFAPSIEGRILSHSHFKRERDPKLVERLKDEYFDKHGHIDCSVCNFDFEKRYGERGHRYMEAHHLRPISQLSPKGETTSMKDLALICANCHRMVHRKSPWLSIDELRRKLQD